MDAREFAARIDHTLLAKDHTIEDVDALLREASRYGTNVCVPPSRVEYAADRFDAGEIVTVVGFPLGYNATEVKLFEAERAVEMGATELDVACNVSHLKSGEHEEFGRDVERVVGATDVDTKAIIETGLLDEEEVRRASRLCVEAGADYVKTSTGFVGRGVTTRDVELVRSAVGDGVGVKASGGIEGYEAALGLLEAGADRIGASRGAEIMRDFLGDQ